MTCGRARVLATAALAVLVFRGLAAAEPGDRPGVSGWRIEQVVPADTHRLRGLPRPLFLAESTAVHGNYYYLSGDDGLLCIGRDGRSGALAGAVASNTGGVKSGGYIVQFTGGRMYTVRDDGAGITWSDVDPATGAPTRKGVAGCPPCARLLASPDGRHLYAKLVGRRQQIAWFRLAEDGKPEMKGLVGGKGCGGTLHDTCDGIMQASPDGRFIYVISADEHAVATIQRDPDGQITYHGSTDLSVMARRDPDGYRYPWASVALSPDGLWLYASLWNAKIDQDIYGIFQRDPDTGALTFRHAFTGRTDPLANLRAWNLVFAADGRAGLLAGWAGPVTAFQYDPKTGRLTDPRAIAGTEGYGTARVAVDQAKGLVYVAGNDEYGVYGDAVYVIRHGPPARPTPPPAAPGRAQGPAAPSAAAPAEPADAPLQIVQTIPAGAAFPLGNNFQVQHHGDYLLTWADGAPGYARRDVQSGRVAYLGELKGDVMDLGARLADAFPYVYRRQRSGSRNARFVFAGGRLYMFTGSGSSLGWYDVDFPNGTFTERGLVECLPASHILAGPDGRDLYVKSNVCARRPVVFWYRLGPDGRPVKAGEVQDPAIGFTGLGYDCFKMSPDGRFLYTLSAEAEIVRLRRRPDGAIAYDAALKLADSIKPMPRQHYQWASLGIPCDGKWMYAYLEDYGPKKENFLAIFRRDVQSGELTFQEAIFEDQDEMAGRRLAQLWFLPDGTGFIGGLWVSVSFFRVDPRTGRFVDRFTMPGGSASPSYSLWLSDFDPANRLGYGMKKVGDSEPALFAVLKVPGRPASSAAPAGSP